MTEVQKIIRKHYRPSQKKFKTRGWEQCGEEIEELIQKKQDKARNTKSFDDMLYSKQCDRLKKIRNTIKDEYEGYFKVGSMYAWIEGNENLAELIK